MSLFRSIFFVLALSPTFSFAYIFLEDTMSKEDQAKTGVYDLNARQKAALEEWLNKYFVVKEEQPVTFKETYLSENINSGKQIRLTDGSLFEIAPPDVRKTALWITPIPIKVSLNAESDYPYILTNGYTHVTVRARRLKAPIQQ